jgi:hypothetical protein
VNISIKVSFLISLFSEPGGLCCNWIISICTNSSRSE